MNRAWDGLLLVDKPSGPTSHDIVATIRRALGGVRAGHTGTLDPPATGLLVVVLGCATRLARFLPSEPKAYAGLLALGVTTTTDDLAGDVLARHDGEVPSTDAVLAAAARLVGRQLQVPPAMSAKHVAGRRSHVLARRGQRVFAPAAEVVVYRFEVSPTDFPAQWTYEMVVSSGTYVRATVRDLGTALGCGAAVASLRRTSIGPLRIEDAMMWTPEASGLAAAAAARLVPIDAMPLSTGDLTLDDAGARRRFVAGASIPCPRDLPPDAPSSFAVRAPSGSLLGIGDLEGDILRPRVVLRPHPLEALHIARPVGL